MSEDRKFKMLGIQSCCATFKIIQYNLDLGDATLYILSSLESISFVEFQVKKYAGKQKSENSA